MSIFHRVIHKLNISEVIYRIQSRRKYAKDVMFTDHFDALNYLHNLYPDSGKSCIIDRILPPSDCDLEVIVPCYNAEKYVEECIDSILSQETSYSFFVTIINDGSNDCTREILQKYRAESNVRIIDQENLGHSGARNAGIAQVHGRYLMFVDSDDVLLSGAIDGLMTLANLYDADVVDSGHIRFADDSSKRKISRLLARVYDFMQRPQILPFNVTSKTMTGFPCGKVIKSELFRNIHFPEGYWFEDTLIWMVLYPLSKRIVTWDEMSFRYRMNPTSISHTFSKSTKSIDSLYVTLSLLNDRKSLGIQFDSYQYDLLLSQMRHNFHRVEHLGLMVKQAIFTVQHDIIANDFASYCTDNPKVKPIEDFLRNNDYYGFDLWCRWH